MNTRSLTVPLAGFGCAPTQATVVVARLTLRERVARSGRVVGAGLVAALIALPIPLVHFIFVPGAVLTGLTLGIIRVQQREIFESAEAPAPTAAPFRDSDWRVGHSACHAWCIVTTAGDNSISGWTRPSPFSPIVHPRTAPHYRWHRTT